MQIKMIWHSKDYTYSEHINETLIFELGQLRHEVMIFMIMNQDATVYLINKCLNELLLNIWKELKIFTLCNHFFHLPKTSIAQAADL